MSAEANHPLDVEVVYRKHWLALLAKLVRPILGITLTAIATLVLFFTPVRGFVEQSPWVVYIPLVLVIVQLLSCLWQYADWKNDMYILKGDKIIEYYRTPLGLGGISQRTTRLANVQSVTVRMNGLIDNLFKVGDVIIRTGGAENDMVFRRVAFPEQVKDTIYQRIGILSDLERARSAYYQQQVAVSQPIFPPTHTAR